jgi:hypothetical protein
MRPRGPGKGPCIMRCALTVLPALRAACDPFRKLRTSASRQLDPALRPVLAGSRLTAFGERCRKADTALGSAPDLLRMLGWPERHLLSRRTRVISSVSRHAQHAKQPRGQFPPWP